MKAFLFAICAAVALSFGAYFVLNSQFQADSTAAFTTEGARLSTGEVVPALN
jgi:EamA domain-containing membrane protein RarD